MLRAFAIYGVIFLIILFLSAIGEVTAEKKSVTAVLGDYRRLTFRSVLLFVALVVAASALLTVGNACSIISKLFLEGWFK